MELLVKIDDLLLLGFGAGVGEVLLTVCFRGLWAGLRRLGVIQRLPRIGDFLGGNSSR